MWLGVRTDCPNIAMAVDRDFKHQTKQTKHVTS